MILLARHGETADNVAPVRVMGRRDRPLTERGREQARALALAVAAVGVRALYTSPLSRARETAEIVGEEVGVEPHLDARLAESNRGRWEGRLLRDIEREEPKLWSAWLRAGEDFRFPCGESLGEHLKRVEAALADVAGGPLPALVVAHGGTIRCAFAASNPRGLAAFHELSVPNAVPLPLEFSELA